MNKYRSNWFRVAVEGATSDKRTIKRAWLEQAAKNFNPATYGARVWMEHFRSLLPDSPFKAYGDVTAVKTEEIKINGQTKLALFAQIEPTPELVAMNKAKQKIYTSIELDEQFADTGEAYIVGLAVTDSPASLGTDVLAFSAQRPEASPFRDRHYSATSMFSEAIEAELSFDQVEDKPTLGVQLLNTVRTLLKGKQNRDDVEFSAIGEAVEAIAEHGKQLAEQFSEQDQANQQLTQDLKQLRTDFSELTTCLSTTQDPNQRSRPLADGNCSQALTNY